MSDTASAKELFADALELSGAERDAFVRRACGNDPALLAEVLDLLQAHERATNFMNTSGLLSARATSVPAGERPGSVIGRYKLIEAIGEGGFGTVFLAQQREPVVRQVALKIIKPGMDTAQVIARFEAERQALAVMDHPNIAKVLDAGATDQGRPYFVMELVKGEPITTYCDRNSLTIPQRLEVFTQVCQAVQHAHTKGVIHRDIKPSNVLVSTQENAGQVRVIDFGIAKATGHALTAKTLFTEHRQLIGTPEYMSPEQADSGRDIDTRTDIYSLGVLLYELLTGSTPFEPRRLRSAAFGELQRIIREEEPPKPSTRLSALEGLPSVAAQRRIEPARLGRIIRGDLDWIVMKALEKDRVRRYETATGLLEDVRRHLAGDAVTAAPPSKAYRVRKFVRRHRAGVVAGMLIGLALVLGMTGTSSGMVWALREQARAHKAAISEAKQKSIAEENEKIAQSQKTLAEASAQAEKSRANELKHVSDFQAEMLAQVDPTLAGKLLTEDVARRFEAALAKAGVPVAERSGQVESFSAQWSRVNATDAARELIDRTILEPAIVAIDRQFKEQPLVDARLRQVLADVYRDLGLYDAALPLQESALATRRRELGEEHPDTLTSISSTGSLLQAQGKLAEAESYRREALEKQRRVIGDDHADTLTSIINVGFVLKEQGKYADAEPYYREGVERYRRVLGNEHQHTLTAINNLAALLEAWGKLTDAEPYHREALETRRRVLGDEHPDTLQSLHNLARLFQAQGRLAEAEPLRREALEKCRRVFGEDHPNTIKTISTMGLLLYTQGKLDQAEPLFFEALEKRRRVLGNEHPDTLHSINGLGSLLQKQGKLDQSEPYRREALETCRRVLGEEHPLTLTTINAMGFLLLAQGRVDEAEPYYQEALVKRRRVLGAEHPDTLTSINNMGFLLQTRGAFAEAEPFLREAIEKRRKVLGEVHPETLGSIKNLVLVLQAQERYSEAESLLLAAVAVAEARLPPEDEARIGVTRAVATLYEAWNKADPGKDYGTKAAEWTAKLDAQTAPRPADQPAPPR